MLVLSNFRVRSGIAIILILVLMASAYAFAAANTVPASSAGDGSGAISGYVVSNITYTLNATNPANIDSVTFDLAGASAATNVQAQLVSTGGWFSCAGGPTTYTCATAGVTALAADQLRVVAAQ